MKRIWITLFAVVLVTSGIASSIADAEAARLGGGRSFGTQRSSSVMRRQAAPPQSPSAIPSRNAAPAQPLQQQPKSGMSRWLGPLAGLAAGVGIASLFSHLGMGGLGGMGGGLGSILMIVLLGVGGVMLFRWFSRRQQTAQAQAAPFQYAGHGMEQESAWHPSNNTTTNTTSTTPLYAQSEQVVSVPEDFDSEGFLRQAKVNFMRMQAANDTCNIDDIRQFTTPEMFAEIRLEMQERGNALQQTDVATLNAALLDVSHEDKQYVASVRFYGDIREAPGAALTNFDEVWHLNKPNDASRGWVVAGIQQYE